ncbi:DsbA family protein [Candidatus Uhrbacteria bacterium]|nr:DsbA family protein [Candidatus Uhrbacteria bacterium]
MGEETPKKDMLLATSILVSALIIGGSFIYGSSRGGASSSASVSGTLAGSSGSGTGQAVAVSASNNVVLGSPGAPVEMVLFGDYQCPFCKKMYDDVEGRIRDEYVATGKVRMVYRDFPIDNLHPFARRAAEAAECAREQGAYWLFHDYLYERQSEIPGLDYGAVAVSLGLDRGPFESCVGSGAYKAEVEADYQDGIAAGVQGTPTTFINGKRLPGAAPYESFRDAIEAALVDAGT